MLAEQVQTNSPEPAREAKIKLLPDMRFIRARISILEVAKELGIQIVYRGATWTTARCFRPENHKTGDSNPSLNFQTKKNKYICFACDERLHSNIDLVMAVEGYTEVIQAINWFEEHYPGIPRKEVQTIDFEWRAGVDDFRNPDDLVNAGLIPHLTESALKVFVVIAAARNGNDVSIVTYDTIMRRSGIKSKSTVAKAIRHLEGLCIFECTRRWSRRRVGKDTTQYSFTFDDPRLFAMLTGRKL